jgi:hypothetical protein
MGPRVRISEPGKSGPKDLYFRFLFAYNDPMGLEVGGYHDRSDWPKMGPSLLIATSLIVAIRTSKWPPRADDSLCGQELNEEINFAAHVAGRVMNTLMTRYESIFPKRKEPWYQADEEDVPK